VSFSYFAEQFGSEVARKSTVVINSHKNRSWISSVSNRKWLVNLSVPQVYEEAFGNCCSEICYILFNK